jgi:hypothetical protein
MRLRFCAVASDGAIGPRMKGKVSEVAQARDRSAPDLCVAGRGESEGAWRACASMFGPSPCRRTVSNCRDAERAGGRAVAFGPPDRDRSRRRKAGSRRRGCRRRCARPGARCSEAPMITVPAASEFGWRPCGPSFFTGADGFGHVATSYGASLQTWQLQLSPSPTLVQEGVTSTPVSSQDPGFFTVVSSNGTKAGTGIIWAVARPATTTTVTLYAFAAAVSGGTFEAWKPQKLPNPA